jgi:hypothetical protein
MKENAQIIAEIDRLKREKPEGWKSDCRRLVRILGNREHQFDEHVFTGNEMTGRPVHMGAAPLFDQMDDESEP